MRIAWHGHACFEIADDEMTVVTDPHDGKSIGIKPPFVKADIILVSHEHFDHNKVSIVSKPESIVIRDKNDEIKGRRINIKVIESYHDNVKGARRGNNHIYIFTLCNVNLCHLGDLGHVLTEDNISQFDRKIDILFIPVGGHFTIDAVEAVKVIECIKPKVIVPMHFKIGGLSLNIDEAENFLKNFDNISKVGNEIIFDPVELEEIKEPEIWLFSL